MNVKFALMLGVLTTEVVLAECVATAYRTGDTIPSYIVLGYESLEGEWAQYQEQFPESARLIDVSPEYFESKPLQDQCLVEFAPENMQDLSNSSGGEKIILQMSCEDFSVGKAFRLIVHSYCVESFGNSPDFYSSLPYRHANIAENERY